MTLGGTSFGRTDGERYGEGRHPALPWGYWLTSTGKVPGEPPLVDEDGRVWKSVRQAFWVGRLGLPELHDTWVNPILEFIMCYLAIVDGRFVPRQERVRDIFLGDGHFDTFFGAWLEASGLVSRHRSELTAEGRCALLMLIATRTREDAEDDVGLGWIDARRGLAGPAERGATADMVRESEPVAARMTHRFAVDEIAGRPAVKLIGLRITREIPVRSTVWSMSWPDRDRHARDCFYLWLLERIDRWDDWSGLVADHGSRALTEHLMRLAFCDRFAAADGVASDNV